MLYSTLVVAAAAFTGFASAQNNTFNTPITCCSLQPNQVSSSDRATWCEASRNTCVDLCGGVAKIASNGNNCDSTNLQFGCKCSNGSDVTNSMKNYQQSVPSLMCQSWYGACVNASGSDATQRFECERARNSCGNLTLAPADGARSSSAPSASRTSGSGSPSGSATGAATGATSSTPGAAAGLVQYSTPILAAGLMAVFGLAM